MQKRDVTWAGGNFIACVQSGEAPARAGDGEGLLVSLPYKFLIIKDQFAI